MQVIGADATAEPSLYDLSVDPRFADFADQVLSQSYAKLGREDLAATTVSEYRPSACEADPSGIAGEEALLEEIARRAAQTRVVIINESHYVSRHRGFIARLAARLRPLGYSHFAAEAFANADEGPAPIEMTDLPPWPSEHISNGGYVSEPAFGRLVRAVRALGYEFVAYEHTNPDFDAPRNEQVAAREAAQAENLRAALVNAGPDTRMLVHVGYSHAAEVPMPRGDGGTDLWMAARLGELADVDPLTISQHQCRTVEGPSRLASGAPQTPQGAFDMIIAHPVTRFAGKRPLWRQEAGDVRILVPPELVPEEGAYIVEARLAGEPDEAIPLDRVLVFAGEEVDLLLPPGRYRLRAVVALADAPDSE